MNQKEKLQRLSNGHISLREQSQKDKEIAKIFPAPTLKGKIKVLLMPQRAMFYCRETQYKSLINILKEQYKDSEVITIEQND